MSVLGPILNALVTLLTGVASSVVPLVNAEAYALLRGQGSLLAAVVLVTALALGQTLGKSAILELSRRGSARIRRFRAASATSDPTTEVPDSRRRRILRQLSRTGSSTPVLFASASLGLPPLAATAVTAGATGVSHRRFAVVCFIGRALRFGIVVATAQAVPLPAMPWS